MNRKLIGLAILVCALAGGKAMAANYGMAGCGVGAMAFEDQPGKIQILASTVNNLVSPQTSAITSGTSNCSDETKTETASLFIAVNQEALKNDISRGNGETLAGLSKILGCSDSGKLGAALKNDYSAIFPTVNQSAKEINRSISKSIERDEALSKTCRT